MEEFDTAFTGNAHLKYRSPAHGGSLEDLIQEEVTLVELDVEHGEIKSVNQLDEWVETWAGDKWETHLRASSTKYLYRLLAENPELGEYETFGEMYETFVTDADDILENRFEIRAAILAAIYVKGEQAVYNAGLKKLEELGLQDTETD